MKTFTVILILALTVSIGYAQDTAFISRERSTALFFPSKVKVISRESDHFTITDKGNGVLAIKALSSNFSNQLLTVTEEASKKTYRIPVAYSYGRAGRRIDYSMEPSQVAKFERPEALEQTIARQLSAGKRKYVAASKRTGSVKGWINKISLAGTRIFLRLDIRNRSNLPYGIDFVRFYIRDKKTVDRTASHEQEIVPLFTTLKGRVAVSKDQEIAKVFSFKRFSLSDDEALFVEVYERAGNRHLYLEIAQSDLDKITVMNTKQISQQSLAAN